MRIYRISRDIDGNFRTLVCDRPGDALAVADFVFKAQSLAEGRDISVSYMPDSFMDQSREIQSGDYPTLSGVVPIFVSTASDTLFRSLNIEWATLSLKSLDGEFVICRPSRLSGCIDVPKTEVSKYTRRFITKYYTIAFYDSDSIKNDLFMLDEISTDIFVTQRFVDCVRVQGLRGMNFVAVN